jgi:hypothetical protein
MRDEVQIKTRILEKKILNPFPTFLYLLVFHWSMYEKRPQKFLFLFVFSITLLVGLSLVHVGKKGTWQHEKRSNKPTLQIKQLKI